MMEWVTADMHLPVHPRLQIGNAQLRSELRFQLGYSPYSPDMPAFQCECGTLVSHPKY